MRSPPLRCGAAGSRGSLRAPGMTTAGRESARCLRKIPLLSLPKPQPHQSLAKIRTRISHPASNPGDNTPVPSHGGSLGRRSAAAAGADGAGATRSRIPKGVACRGDARSSRVQGRTAQGRGGVPVPVQEMVAAIPARRVQKDRSLRARPIVRACGSLSVRSVSLRRNGINQSSPGEGPALRPCPRPSPLRCRCLGVPASPPAGVRPLRSPGRTGRPAAVPSPHTGPGRRSAWPGGRPCRRPGSGRRPRAWPRR